MTYERFMPEHLSLEHNVVQEQPHPDSKSLKHEAHIRPKDKHPNHGCCH